MSDLPNNNNPNDKCFYCSHIFTFHSSYSDDDNKNIPEGIENKKKPRDDDIPKGCRFVNNDDGSSCICPGFRSASSIT
jgi:hypothetical protein